jgi:hypothetical protein
MAKTTYMQSNGGNGVQQPLDVGSALFAGLARATETYVRTFSEINREALRFAEARVHANNNTAKLLSGCQSIADMATIQQKWAATETEAYVSQAARFADLGMRMMTDSIAMVPGHVDKTPRA